MDVEDSSDDEGFVPVVGGKRKKLDGAFADGVELVENLLQNNKFGPLAGNINNGSSAGGSAPAVSPGHRKQPPLMVVNKTFGQLTDVLIKHNFRPDLKLTRSGIKILSSTAEEFDTLQAILKKHKVEYYTHAKPSERLHRVVIRGLPQLAPEDIKDSLKSEHKLEALEVRAIKRKDESTPVDETPYVILFPKGYTNLKKLREIKHSGPMIIRWEAYRNKQPNVTQCRNCLRLGHGARNCHLKARCNKCGGAHKSEECKPEEAQPKRCANCAGAHEAMDRSCPKRAEFIRARQQAAKPKPPASKKVPAFNLDEFPPLPGAVPGEPSPQAGGSNRCTGPGAGGTKKNPQPGGKQDCAGSRAEATTKAEKEEELYSAEELWKLFLEFSAMLKKCRTRSDQVRVVAAMAYRSNAK